MVAKPQTNKKTYASVPNSSSETILRKAGTVVAKPQTNKKTYASVLNSSSEITLTKAVMAVAKPKSNKTTYEETQRRQWSNLSEDLLNLIIIKLCFSDRIRFRAVCKDWHLSTGDQPVNELPWLMTHTFFYSWDVPAEEIRVMLSDPVHKKTHTIPNFVGISDEYFNCFKFSRIRASKRGWLLLANNKRDTEIGIFLYSPFINKVIMLPTLIALTPYNGVATFSSNDPKVPDCVFIVMHSCTHRGLGISTYRNGDSNWRTKIVDANFNCSVVSLVCTESGVCFFVLQCGKLGFFRVESQEFGWLVDSVWIVRGWTPRYDIHLVESIGGLLLARYCFASDCCEVFRYDGNKRDWVEQKSLGNMVLFIGYSSYLRPAIGDMADLADKVFYICRNGFVSPFRVYSLKDGKWNNKIRAYDWMAEDPYEKVLIEPPLLR